MRFPTFEAPAVRWRVLSLLAVLWLVPPTSQAESLVVRSSTAWTGAQNHPVIVDFSSDGLSAGLSFELAFDSRLELSPSPPVVSIPNANTSCRFTAPGRIKCLMTAPTTAAGLATGTITLACGVPETTGEYPVSVIAANFYDQQAMPRTATIGGGLVAAQKQPTLSIEAIAVAEGNAGAKKAQFTITLSPASMEAVSLRVSTRPGTATPGVDYTGLDDLLVTIPAGATTAMVGVDVLGDMSVEGNETFALALHDVEGAAGEGAHAKGTILDDDVPQLRISDASVKEGSAGSTTAAFVVSLSHPVSTPVTFDFTTTSGSALSGTDFQAVSGSARQIDAGRTRVLVEVPIVGDLAPEGDETFSVLVSSAVGADIVDASATGTIIDDDAPSVVTIGIAAVQGVGSVSPMLGRVVEVRGVVTGVAAYGYFLQSVQPDDNPLSSEGIFVNSIVGDLKIGDLVRVRGAVSEDDSASKGLRSSETQLSEIARVREGTGIALPAAVQVSLPALAWQRSEALEQFEGMRISLDKVQVVGPTSARRDAGGKLKSTAVSHVVADGVPRTFERGQGNPERLVLDAAFLGGPPMSVNVGDLVGKVVAVVGVSEGHYALRIATSEPPAVVGNAIAVPAPEAAADRAAVAFMRVAEVPESADAGVALAEAVRLARAVCTMASAPDLVVVSANRAVQYSDALEALFESDAPSLSGCAPGTGYRLAGQGASDATRLVLVKSFTPGQAARSAQVTFVRTMGEQARYVTGNHQVRLFERAPVLLGVRLAGPSGKSLAVDVLVVSLAAVASRDSGSALQRKAQDAFVEKLVQGRLAANPASKLIVLGNYADGIERSKAGSGAGASRMPEFKSGEMRDAGDDLSPALRYTAVESGDAVQRDAILISPAIREHLDPRIYPVRINADFSEDLADELELPLRLSDQDPLVLQLDYP